MNDVVVLKKQNVYLQDWKGYITLLLNVVSRTSKLAVTTNILTFSFHNTFCNFEGRILCTNSVKRVHITTAPSGNSVTFT